MNRLTHWAIAPDFLGPAILLLAIAPLACDRLGNSAGPVTASEVSVPLDLGTTVSGGEGIWEIPVDLGPPLSDASDEFQLGIAPNGRSLYISSDRVGTLGGADLWVSHQLSDDSWSEPVNLGPSVNSPAREFSPTVSLDGHWLYFASDRPGGFGGLDCWRSYRDNPDDDSAWQPAENLGPAINTARPEGDCLIAGHAGGTQAIWFTSLNRPEGQGDWDIYQSRIAQDGTIEPATPMVELNTPYRDTRMTLSADGLVVFFSSNRPGGSGGIDLWYAVRQSPNDPFCSPVNLGSGINTPANDRSPSISANGLQLYFTSDRLGGYGSDDVYLSQRGTGPRFQPCPP